MKFYLFLLFVFCIGNVQCSFLENAQAFLVKAVRGGKKGTALSNGVALQEITTTELLYNVNIDTHYARAEVTTTFVNDANEPVNTVFKTIVPIGAYITGFEMTIDGITFVGEVMPKQEAQDVYDDAVDRGDNAGLVSNDGPANLFSIAVSISAQGQATFRLTHDLLIARRLDWFEYSLDILQAEQEFFDTQVTINIVESDGITTIETPAPADPEPEVILGATLATITYPPADGAVPQNDFTLTLRYKTQRPELDVGTFLTDSEREYFVHLFTPPELPPMKKAVVFVLDQSGSMMGSKFEQLKEATQLIIDQLDSQDYFNIIFFDHQVNMYSNNLIPASNSNRADGKHYVAETNVDGSTDINFALLEGLGQLDNANLPDGSNFARQIIFVTDGLPSAGVTNAQLIRSNVREANGQDHSIYCLGIGYDLDYDLIRGIALENYGFERRIRVDNTVAEQLTTFFDEIDTPIMSDLLLDYESDIGPISDVTEKFAPILFQGSELLVSGRLPVGVSSVTISTFASSSTYESLEYESSFDVEIASQRQTEIPVSTIWAFRELDIVRQKIAVLQGMDNMQEELELQEARGLELSLEFGFVNEWTSLVVVEDCENSPDPTCGQDDENEDENGDDDEMAGQADEDVYDDASYFGPGGGDGGDMDDDEADYAGDAMGGSSTRHDTLIISTILGSLIFLYNV